jgi:hypothetical protein
MGPFWITNEESGTYQLDILSGEVLSQWANGFRLKPYYGKLSPNPFPPKDSSGGTSREVSAENKD